MKKIIDLDEPLIEFDTGQGKTPFLVRHAFENFGVFGGVGAGKSSSSGRLISLKFLQSGWGGVVLVCKNDERARWVEYCKLTGRSNDLVIVEPGGNHRFNFLQYLGKLDGAGLTENIVDTLKTVIKTSNEKNSGKSNDEFWTNALDQVLNFTVQLAKIAYETLTIETLYELIQTLPRENVNIAPKEGETPTAFYQAFTIARTKIKLMIFDWETDLGVDKINQLKREKLYNETMLKACPEVRIFKYIDEFFFVTYRSLASKTRSVIDFSVSGFFFRLLSEPVFSLLCDGESTITPESCGEGAIIVINLPTSEYGKVGREAQLIFKLLWQKAMRRRVITEETLPVFSFADEAQEFLFEHDQEFQTVSRSSYVSNVLLSQNLNNYFAVMAGDRSEYRVRSLMGTIGTKIFHSNSDSECNEYSSLLIGDSFKEVITESISISGENHSHTSNKSIQLERTIRPEEFVGLATGGARNNYSVQAIIHKQGDKFINGKNYLKVSFNQNYNPTNKNNSH
jgi:Type IV secretory system Conjugative DNA transfer